MINIQHLIDDAKCFEVIRRLHWPEGVRCPKCGAALVNKRGFHTHQAHRQRYECQVCGHAFDDLSETIVEGHHQPLRVWVWCLYFMGLNLSNEQIAAELDLAEGDAQTMTTQLREGIVVKKKPVQLTGKIEADEMYLIAGHKGQPDIVAQEGRPGRRRRLKGKRGRGTLAEEKPPVLGLLQRDGEVVIRLLPNVQQATSLPVITSVIAPGSLVYTDAYNIYDRLPEWGYEHKSVNHTAGEYSRDEDGDGFHKVHVNTLEGFWSLLRSWLRPHRGISQEKLPWYLGFFEFVHNIRRRGKALLHALLAALVAP
jgi:transposase-like protein